MSNSMTHEQEVEQVDKELDRAIGYDSILRKKSLDLYDWKASIDRAIVENYTNIFNLRSKKERLTRDGTST